MSADLPKMPEPFKYPEGDVPANCACGSWPGGKCLRCQPVNFYTADQMREYAQEAARQAMERCAEVCEQVAREFKFYPELPDICAERIRALLPQSEKRHG